MGINPPNPKTFVTKNTLHQIMLISLFPKLFGYFQILGSAGQNPKTILTLRHMYVDWDGIGWD